MIQLKWADYSKACRPQYAAWGLTVLVLVAVDILGRMVMLSDPIADQEANVLRQCNVEQLLEQIAAKLGRSVGVLTDSGLTFNRAGDNPNDLVAHAFTVGPKTMNRLKHVAFDSQLAAFFSSAERAMALRCLLSTRYVSKFRTVVENYNSHLRHVCKAFREKLRTKLLCRSR